MIKLEIDNYNGVIEVLESMTFNTLFAKAVILKQISGSVYVDNVKEPSVFYIAHPYGMSLLFGNTESEKFNTGLFHYLINTNEVRNNSEWLQVFPTQWRDKIETILGLYLVKKDSTNKNGISSTGDDFKNKVVEQTRINFTFKQSEYEKAVKQVDKQKYEIVCTTGEMYRNIQGSVVPKYFWRNEDQFLTMGLGYSLIYEGEIASTAFSAFRHKNQLEIGIETLEKYRGKGFALRVCSALIECCIEKGLQPVWACRKENVGSYQLAQKLGFVPALSIPYYRLVIK